MLNREKYAKEIIELAVNTGMFALKNGKPAICKEIKCEECDFYESDSCKGSTYNFREWLNSEYVEPPVDWSNVAVDTPILVRDSREEAWRKRYFAKYENGIVFTWGYGATSWSACRSDDIIDWKFAKLAESEEKIIECIRNAACEHMTLDEQISFCEEKSKNIKLNAKPQTFVDIKNSLEKLKELRGEEKISCNCKHNRNSRDNEPCCRCDSKVSENDDTKNKVTSLEIIVRMIDNKPYYEIKYKKVGEDYYHVGYSSFNIDNVLKWRDECFELVDMKMTNADRIRNMSDEELAESIMCPAEYDLGFNKECECNGEMNINCCKCTLKWLQSEAE